VNSFN